MPEHATFYEQRHADVLEYLKQAGEAGASRDEIMEHFHVDVQGPGARTGWGRSLKFLAREDFIREREGRYYHPEAVQKIVSGFVPALVQTALPLNGVSHGHAVAVFSSPETFQGVTRLRLQLQNQQVIEVPVWQDLKICYGASVPNWSDSQLVYEHIAKIEITHQGKTTVRVPNAHWKITVAPY